MRMTLRHYVCSIRQQLDKRAADVQESPSLYGACWPREWLWVDSNGTDGKPTFHRRANLSSRSKICNHFREIAAWSRKSLTMIKVFLEKKTPWGQIFKKCFRKDSPPHRTMFCVQTVWKLADQKSANSCVYLTKKQNFCKVSRSRFCADCTQNLSGPAPNNILGVPQISSKSVHFRRSYSGTREHHWNVPQSISNTRRSFLAE